MKNIAMLLVALAINGVDYIKGQLFEVTDANRDYFEKLVEAGQAKWYEAEDTKSGESQSSESGGNPLDEIREPLKNLIGELFNQEIEGRKGTKTPVVIERIVDPIENDKLGGFKSAGHFFDTVRSINTGSANAEQQKNVTRWVDFCNDRAKSMASQLGVKELGMNEGRDEEGGILVPEEVDRRIRETMVEEENLFALTTNIPINRSVKIPMMNDQDRSKTGKGGRYAGVQVVWPDEGETIDPSKLYFDSQELKLKKMAIAVKATSELMNDSSIALENFIIRQAGLAIGWERDEMIIHGKGAGKPLGFLNSASLVTIAKEASQVADTIVAENIVNMFASFKGSTRTARWLVNDWVWTQLPFLKMESASGMVSLFTPPGGFSQAPYGTLMGIPVVKSEHSPALGDVGDIGLFDFAAYNTASKIGSPDVNVASSIHVYFLQDELVWRFTTRWDGQPSLAKQITPARGSHKLSTHVVLAERS